MRAVVLDLAGELGLAVLVESMVWEAVLSAKEVFLTNAVTGIRWVDSAGGVTFSNSQTARLSEALRAHLL